MRTYSDKTQDKKSKPVISSNIKKLSSSGSSYQFIDNRPEAVLQQKLCSLVNSGPRAKQLKAFQHVADSRSSEAPAKAEISVDMANPLGELSFQVSPAQSDHSDDTVQMTRIGRNMTRHYNDHRSEDLPNNGGELIDYVEASWDYFDERGENRFVLELGDYQTRRRGGVWEPRVWSIVMMGDTIVHFGPAGW